MPLGNGYFYDRKKKKLIAIDEHATDAVQRPDVFRSKKICHLNPVTDRDTIVIYTIRQGFIRIRHWKGDLGFQFWGNGKEAKKILVWFAKKYGVGEYCRITYTDFKRKVTRVFNYVDMDATL
jgi:hypothetical protein